MQYTKSMIELVFEIRRRVNAQSKPGVKLANPDLLSELAEIYHHSKDTILRTLIKELLTSAGDNWPTLLQSRDAEKRPSTVKVYRGQVSLEPKTKTAEPAAGITKTTRYYRGVKIA